MQQKKRSKWWIILGITFLISLGYFLYTFPPSGVISYPIPSIFKPVYLLFILTFLSLFMLTTYILRRKRRGIILALFVCGYLALRYNNFTDPLFVILLLAFFLSIEIVFSKLHF